MKPDENEKPEQKEQKVSDSAMSLLNNLQAEFFDPELAEKWQRARDCAQQFFALYQELKNAGFSKQEAYGIVIAMVGGGK